MLSLYENAPSLPPRLRCGFFYLSLVSHADNSQRIERGWDPLRILWHLLVWLGYILTQKPISTVPFPSWLSTPIFWANNEVALPFKETDLFVFNLFGTGLKLTVFKKCPHTSSLFVYFVEVVCSLRHPFQTRFLILNLKKNCFQCSLSCKL